MDELKAGEDPPEEVAVVDGKVRVVVVHSIDEESARRMIEVVGGIVEGTSPGVIQALVPFEEVEDLESDAAVAAVRVPLRVDAAPDA